MKKVLNVLLSIIVTLTIMIQPLSQVYSDTSSDLEPYLAGFQLIVDNEVKTGVWEADVSQYIEDGKVALNYTFGFPDELNIDLGKEYTMALPKGFKSNYSEPEKQDFTMEMSGTLYTMGQYWMENDGTIKFVFNNEEINKHDNRILTQTLHVNLDESEFEDGDGVEVDYEFNDGGKYNLIINPEHHEFEYNDGKDGYLYTIVDGEKNPTNDRPTHAHYSVKLNSQLKTLDNAKVIDTLLSEQELVEGSFKITKVIYNKITGEVKNEEDVTSNFNVQTSTNGFEIDFGSINTEYIIEYDTTLNTQDFGETEIKNKVTITLGDVEKEDGTNFTAKWGKDNPPISKKHLSTNKDEITWEVYYNFNGDDVGDKITLKDKINEGYYIDDSLEVFKVDVTTDGNPTNWVYINERINTDWNETENKLEITIEDQNKQALVLRYKTKVDANFKGEITNDITDDKNRDDAKTSIDTTPSTSKNGVVGYEDGKAHIDWTITINTQKFNITKPITVKDAFKTSLITLETESVKVYKNESNTKMEDGFTFNKKANSGFELTISDVGPNTYTIKYRTAYTDDGLKASKDKIKNDVTINTGGEDVGIEENPNTTPEPGINKSGDYESVENSSDEDRINWKVTFNQNGLKLKTPTITDTFEPNNIKLIDGTLKLYRSDDAENPLEEGTNFTYSKTTDSEDKETGFIIKFLEDTDAVSYVLEYQTTVDPENPEQKNTVHIIDEKELESSDDDTVAKRTLGLTKSGEQKVLDGTKLNEYTIEFNTEKHAIGGLVLTDTYSPKNVEVKYLTLTFEDGTKVPTDSYTIAYDEDLGVDSNLGEDQGRFKITFVGTTERKVYVLKYSTTYPIEEQKKDVKNTVEIEYNGGEESKDKTISRPLLKVEKAAGDVDTTNVPYVISWEIQANTDRLNNNVYLKDATLTDTIESDQKYVEGSMKLFIAERDTNGDLTQGEKLPVNNSNLSWDGSTFTLDLPDGLTEYIVTYDTKAIVYPSNNAKEGYYNQVILENDTVNKKFYDSDTAEAYKKLFDGEENNNSDKTGYQDPETDEIVWSVVINKHSMPINKGYMEDELDEHQTYIQDKFKVEVAVGDGENETYEEIAEEFYDLVFNTEGEKESFKLTFKERTSDPTEIEGGITHKYKITYRAELKEEFLGVHKISNAFSIIGEGGEEIDDTDSGDFNAEKWYSFAGGSGITAHLDIEKSDYVDKDKKLSLVEFALYRVVGNEEILIKDDIITDIEGEAHVSTLRAGRYILKETNGRFGYEGLPDEGVKFILSYNSDKEPVVTLDDASWSSSLGDLVDVEGSKLKVFNKKDTESKPSTEITLTKTWDDGDNADGLRPESITINVLADGEVYETHVLSAVDYLENDWSFTITDLPKENEDSSDIVYTLQELSEGDYGVEYDQENYTITNAREYDKTSFEGTKVWNDDSNRDGIRPESLEITLYRYLDSIDDKEKVDTILLTDLFSDSTGNTWSYSFVDLQKNHHGQEFTYFAEEEIVEGYEQSGENGHFVNTYEPLTRSISVAKEWEDLDNAYELRPESITIELLKNGEDFKTAVLSESNDWKYTFEPLFVYEDGVQIEYTIHEMKVRYYAGTVVNVEGDLDSYVITNTINRGELPTTSLTVVKDWVNGPKGDVVFNLLQNGEAIDSIELTEEMGWTYTFAGLEKFDEEGQEYIYFAEEITKLENYITSEPIIEGNTVTITNTYVSPKTDVSVKKVWVGEKTDSVTINLYADGKEVSHVKLTDENNWEHVFEDLDATTLDGEAITYTVDEVKLDGYETDIKGDAIEGFTVTNTQIKGEVGSKLPLTGSVSLGQLALISILVSGAFFSLNRKGKRNRYFD